MGKERKKFNEVEIILGTFIFLIIEFLLFIGVGLFLKPFSVFIIEWWAWTKGAPWEPLGTKRLLKYIGNVLPLATLITFFVSVYLHNHPEKFGVVQKLGKLNVKSLKNVKAAKGTVAAAKEGYRQYRQAA